MTGINVAQAARSTWRLIRWASCWPRCAEPAEAWSSRPPTNRNACAALSVPKRRSPRAALSLPKRWRNRSKPSRASPSKRRLSLLALSLPKRRSVAFVDQGDTGEQPAADAHGIRLEVVKRSEAKRGFVLRFDALMAPLPRCWVVERGVAWRSAEPVEAMARFRRLARNDERWPETVAGLHVLAVAMLMLKRFITVMLEST